ncbi:MAG: DUF3122 domain-containing protein [Cyanobacteria bacterium]|nr:DUF3122 domain-containing protein [Cyanobacteriota bacterium]MDA0864897.1 DUF3122 domain-containing protein [Cyanobacteriota bacterium]
MANRWIRLLWALTLLVLVLVGKASPAQANVHIYQERPGQITYRAQQSLRDSDDRAWQAVTFKRLQQGQLQGIYLRLVGFPGTVSIDRQAPLVVLATTGQQWPAQPALDPQTVALPDSVGQYEVRSLLAGLHNPQPLELQIPLQGTVPATIQVAPFVVREWLETITQGD